MSLEDKVKSVASEVGTFANGLPDNMEDARLIAESWQEKARVFVRQNPGPVVIGAFLVGFILAKVGRHV